MKVLVVYYGYDMNILNMKKSEIKKLKKENKGIIVYKLGRKL